MHLQHQNHGVSPASPDSTGVVGEARLGVRVDGVAGYPALDHRPRHSFRTAGRGPLSLCSGVSS